MTISSLFIRAIQVKLIKRNIKLTFNWRFLFFKGGPLLSKSNGDLLGVTSFHHNNGRTPQAVKFQVFTNVPYYYRWIETRTGLKLPKCTGPQAYDFPELN